MEIENIIKFSDKISALVDNYNDIVGDEASSLAKEYSIDSSDSIKKTIQSIENKDRLLQIGIVGRVKAGKSSLLNALLFNGKAILPKAATPMTAALTMIAYDEKLSAEVEFFSATDIKDIKENYKKYINILEKKTNEKEEKLRENTKVTQENPQEIRKKAIKQAKVEMREYLELSAAFDQYQKMEQSGISIDSLEDTKKLDFSDIFELSTTLLEYVSADGRYMPFTKSVTIKLPDENLQNIQIVDTPGINDPVQSREERTRELLKYCDVIFILSPSGHFLSKEDLNLMDRITTKEGIRELYVIASQVDTQLFGNAKGNNLQQVLQGITSTLGKHLSSTLTRLKENNPEVETTFDQLITQGKEKVVHSSGICQTIKIQFEERENWDDGAQKVWENLTLHYPDYFSDNDKTLSISSLELLANISEVENITTQVKTKKDEILNKRKEEFIQAKYSSLIKYKEGLLIYAKGKMSILKNSSIEEIKKQKSNLEKTQIKASSSINEEYYDLVDELQIQIKNKLTGTLLSYFQETGKNVEEVEVKETKSYTTGWWLWKKTHSYTESSVRTGAVRSFLENLTLKIENTISSQSQDFIRQWKKNLYSQLIKTLRNSVDDDDLEPQLIRSTIRNVLNTVIYPDIEYGGNLPDNLNIKGTLTGSSAEKYIQDAQDYLSKLKRRVNNDIKKFLESLINKLKNIDISIKIFGNYKESIEQLEEQINHKEMTIERLNNFIKELEGVN